METRTIYRRYRYRLYPNACQQRQLAGHFGAVRWVYNWALETKMKAWEENKENIGLFAITRQLTILKKEGSRPWLSELSATSLEVSVANLDNAYQRFFKGAGFPKFKSKGNREVLGYRSAAFAYSPVVMDKGVIKIPKIGPVKCVIDRPFTGKFKQLTLTKTPSNKYFASCLVECEEAAPQKPLPSENQAIGVDLGIKTFATLSNGECIANPRHLSKSLKRLRQLHRQHSKKQKGSQNREKSRRKLAQLYEKVTNQRQDFLHKVTTKLIRENQTICIEDLNVGGMSKLPRLAQHIRGAAFGEFRRQLTYKAEWYGRNLLVVDRFAPSSKQCSCGVKNEALTLKDRTWTCPVCQTTHDRDLLAAQNIVRFAFHKVGS